MKNALSKFAEYDGYYASKFEEKKYGDPIGKNVLETQKRALSKMVDEYGTNVLDVGAGTGWISLYLMKNKGASAVALDASKKMLEFARKQAKSQKTELNVIVGDAQSLPIRDRSFNYVVSFRTLMHLKNPKVAITEMCRVSNKVILDFPSKTSISGITETFMSFSIFTRFIYNLKGNPMEDSKLSKLFSRGKTFFLFRIRTEFEANRFDMTLTQKYFALPIFFYRRIGGLNLLIRLEAILKKTKFTSVFGSPIAVKAKRTKL